MKSVLLAFAMFSRIPVRQPGLGGENPCHAMAAFPLVGLVIGLGLLGWAGLSAYLGFGPLLRGAGFTLLPLCLSGGIHVDGFCDTVDALASHGDHAIRQRILRDPHMGSFAALALCGYYILFFALAAEVCLPWPRLVCLGLAFAVSRSVVGLAVLGVPGVPESTLARHFQKGDSGQASRLLLWGWLAVLGLVLWMLDGVTGLVAIALPLVLLWRWKGFSVRHFGGMSGDLAGYLLLLCELASLAALVIVPHILLKLQAVQV